MQKKERVNCFRVMVYEWSKQIKTGYLGMLHSVDINKPLHHFDVEEVTDVA